MTSVFLIITDQKLRNGNLHADLNPPTDISPNAVTSIKIVYKVSN